MISKSSFSGESRLNSEGRHTTDLNREYHGCHRHQFSKFKIPDFSLIKVKFPWPNKCKISDMVAASNLRLQLSCALIWPEMFLLTFDGIKSVLQIQFSLTFLQNAKFSLTQNKIPWHFPRTLKNLLCWLVNNLWNTAANPSVLLKQHFSQNALLFSSL